MADQKIDALTSLRFFAAAAIVAYHCRGHFGLSTNFLSPFELSQGVSFFFVLSGFILAFVYPTIENGAARSKFWLARFGRVWPLHLTTLLLFMLMLPELWLNHTAISLPLLANLFLLQGWIPVESFFFSFNAVAWSISTEAFFYLSFPFLIKNFARTWPLKLASSLALVLVMANTANLLHLPAMAASAVSMHGMMYINPLTRIFEFVLGMTVAHLYRRYLIGRSASWPLAFSVEAATAALVYLLTLNSEKIAHALARQPFIGAAGQIWLQHAGVPVLAFALTIAVIAWGRGPLASLLRLRLLVFLGEISFATYLLHRLLLHYYWDHFAPEQGLIPIAIYVSVLLLASYVCWALVEVPCRQLIVKRGFGPGTKVPSRAETIKNFGAPLTALAAIFVIFFGLWSGQPLQRISVSADKNLALASQPGIASGTTFGDDLRLYATSESRDERGLTVALYWQALRPQKLQNYVAVRLLGEGDVLVRLKDYRQSAREESVARGDRFKSEIFIPADQLLYVRSLALSLVRPVGASPAGSVAIDVNGPAVAGAAKSVL